MDKNKMFNFRYNLLAILQVSLSIINSVLLIRLFGVSYQTDSYLMAVAIIAALQLLQLMSVEQFMYFYHDLKVKSVEEAHNFYRASITFGVVVGIITFIVLWPGISIIINIFAHNLDPTRYNLLSNILIILIAGLIFNPMNYINQRLLNAEMKFSLPYILDSLYYLFISISLFYILLTNNTNIIFLAYANVLGIMSAFILSFILIRRLKIPIKPKKYHPMMNKFIKNSLSMKLGHNIHNILFTPVTNNILALLPIGFASYFYYAQMIVVGISSIVMGPQYRVLLSNVSTLWSEKKIKKIIILIKRYLKLFIPLFIAALALAYFLIPTLLDFISSGTLSYEDVRYIQLVFLGLGVWYVILMAEGAFVSVGMASKNSKIFIFTNSIFIIVYFCLSLLLVQPLGIFAIPVAAVAGQLINFIFYSTYAFKVLNINIREKLIK
jgi:O-antigen/teichoic acid export membrane protein